MHHEAFPPPYQYYIIHRTLTHLSSPPRFSHPIFECEAHEYRERQQRQIDGQVQLRSMQEKCSGYEPWVQTR